MHYSTTVHARDKKAAPLLLDSGPPMRTASQISIDTCLIQKLHQNC